MQKQDDASDDDETDSKPPPADSGSPPDQELLHKMFVFRFKLMQFINSIHNHFMTRVSHITYVSNFLLILLIINQVKTKEIITVSVFWKPGLN